MTWKNVKIRSELYEQVLELAKREKRSTAAMLGELISQSLWAIENQSLVDLTLMQPTLEALKQAGEVGEGIGPGTPSTRAGVVPLPSPTSSRKTKCEHRIPAGSYCRVCD